MPIRSTVHVIIAILFELSLKNLTGLRRALETTYDLISELLKAPVTFRLLCV